MERFYKNGFFYAFFFPFGANMASILLPSILGKNAMPDYRGYQADVNPGIANEFSTAAFRFGHSMLGTDIEFLDNDGEEIFDAMELRDSFFNPVVLSDTGIDPVLKYLASDNAQEIDPIVVDDVRNFLFGEPGQGGFNPLQPQRDLRRIC